MMKKVFTLAAIIILVAITIWSFCSPYQNLSWRGVLK